MYYKGCLLFDAEANGGVGGVAAGGAYMKTYTLCFSFGAQSEPQVHWVFP